MEEMEEKDAVTALLRNGMDISRDLLDSILYQLHDQISIEEALDDNPRPMIMRYMMRFLFEMYSEEIRDPSKVDQAFQMLYLHIAGTHIGTEDFKDKFECCWTKDD